jgi:single-strand DNA-binding protein
MTRGETTMGVNKAILIGNLGADPEMRYTQAGAAVVNFTLAVNDKWTDRSGERQEKTTWVRCVAWGKQAEVCGQYMRKGSQAYIEGRIQNREWEDREGNKRTVTEVVVQNIQMIGRLIGGSERKRQEEETTVEQPLVEKPAYEEDIPF